MVHTKAQTHQAKYGRARAHATPEFCPDQKLVERTIREEDYTKLPPKLRKNFLASNKCKGTEISQIKNLTKCFWSHQPQALEKIPLTEKKS